VAVTGGRRQGIDPRIKHGRAGLLIIADIAGHDRQPVMECRRGNDEIRLREGMARLAAVPLGFYVCSLRSVRVGMTSLYRIERDRGSKESRQQLAVLREKWPLAFPVQHQDVRPLAMGVARQVAAAMGWSLAYTLGVLGRWKMAEVYCQAVLCHDQRIALDGAPAETVDAEAKDLATKQLAQLAARKTAKKAAEAAAPAVVKPKHAPAPAPPITILKSYCD
jgi:hypothetical protein